jgi:predicted RNase H-like nuclease (RuvC/YqgF family)
MNLRQTMEIEQLLKHQQTEIESLKYRVTQLEMSMSNVKRKQFEEDEEAKRLQAKRVKDAQAGLDRIEKLGGL